MTTRCAAISDNQLPADAKLVPIGDRDYVDLWSSLGRTLVGASFNNRPGPANFAIPRMNAIAKVVTSSLRNQLAKDNSQVIISYDEKLAYRVILTTGVRYFNGDREFNIYFVECLRPRFGDRRYNNCVRRVGTCLPIPFTFPGTRQRILQHRDARLPRPNAFQEARERLWSAN